MKLKTCLHWLSLCIAILIASTMYPASLQANMYQRCVPGSDCLLGEYVFNESGEPITIPICTITIKDPTGTPVVTDQAMTAAADGWHYYTVNLNSPEGLYRALMYCDDNGDSGYLDKNFVLGNSLDTLASTSDLNSAVASIKTIDNWDLGDIVTSVSTIQSRIGTSTDSSTQNTIFGKIADVKSIVNQLNNADTDIDTLINKWGSYSAQDIYDKVKNLSSEISSVNSVSNVDSILTFSQTSTTELKDLKNNLLALKAVVDINRTFLEKTSNAPIIKTWLEEGSMVFKTMIINPSEVVVQTVPLKYYLPYELKKEEIIEKDIELEVDYDASQGTLYVHGEFELQPGESKTVSVQTIDIWEISETEVNSIRNHAEKLSTPLVGTSYFAQGSSLLADINASLDRVAEYQKNTPTPQAKIRAYREALIELEAAQKKLNDLKTIAAAAGSDNSMYGFVGGIQTVIAWGLILVFVAGFIFMAIMMKSIITSAKTTPAFSTTPLPAAISESHQIPIQKMSFTIGIVVLLLGLILGAMIYLFSQSGKIQFPTANLFTSNPSHGILVNT